MCDARVKQIVSCGFKAESLGKLPLVTSEDHKFKNPQKHLGMWSKKFLYK